MLEIPDSVVVPSRSPVALPWWRSSDPVGGLGWPAVCRNCSLTSAGCPWIMAFVRRRASLSHVLDMKSEEATHLILSPFHAPVHFANTLSIFRMILLAHCTAAATIDSVLGLGLESNRSSAVFRCRATSIPATMASTRLRPSSIPTFYRFRLLFVQQRNRIGRIFSAP